MPLKGIKVLEFVGLAPGPFCGKILADFGATVTRIDKVWVNHLDVLSHGKGKLAVDLKRPEGKSLVRKIAQKYDVLIDPFRAGVMEKLGLGPEMLCVECPRLIYARLTGFGQEGPLSQRAGHDINYAAISGLLSMLGEKDGKPLAPINLAADFAGGGLLCALGICLALLERHRSGYGQIVDAAMVEGAAYVASWLFMSRKLPIWRSEQRGDNFLDGGAYFYDTYETKDGKFMSVGALESQFFDVFKEKVGLPELTQYPGENEAQAKAAVKEVFLRKTQAEWASIFEDIDACVYPVVEWQHVAEHKHNKARESFEKRDDVIIPTPAPRLSRTPGNVKEQRNSAEELAETVFTLNSFGISKEEVEKLIDERILVLPVENAKL